MKKKRLVRRRLAPEARREELIDAAIKVMREQGDVVPRISDVTSAAGAAKGTFYLYFASWDELVIAVRDRLTEGIRAGMKLRAEGVKADEWRDFLEQEAERFVDDLLGLGPLHQAIFHGPSSFRSTGVGSPAVVFVSHLLERGIKAGAFQIKDVPTAGLLLFSAWHAVGDAISRGGDRRKLLEGLNGLMRSWL